MKKITPLSLFATALLLVGRSPSASHALSENAFISCVRGDIERVDKFSGPDVKMFGVAYASLVTTYFNSKSKQNETMRNLTSDMSDCEDLEKFITQQSDAEIKRLQEVDFENRGTLSEKKIQRWADFLKPSDLAKADAFTAQRLKAAGFTVAAQTLGTDSDFLRSLALVSDRKKVRLTDILTGDKDVKNLLEVEAENIDLGAFYTRRKELKKDLAEALDTCGCNWKIDIYKPVARIGMKKSAIVACVKSTNDLATLNSYLTGKEMYSKVGGLVSNAMNFTGMGSVLMGSPPDLGRVHDGGVKINEIVATAKDCATLKKMIKVDNAEYIQRMETSPRDSGPDTKALADFMAPESTDRHMAIKAYMLEKLDSAGMDGAFRTFKYEHGLLRLLIAQHRHTPYAFMASGRVSKANHEQYGVRIRLQQMEFPGDLATATADQIEAFLLKQERQYIAEKLRALREIES